MNAMGEGGDVWQDYLYIKRSTSELGSKKTEGGGLSLVYLASLI